MDFFFTQVYLFKIYEDDLQYIVIQHISTKKEGSYFPLVLFFHKKTCDNVYCILHAQYSSLLDRLSFIILL